MSSPILVIAWHEFLINRRNRWVVSFAVLFASLTLAVAYFGMVTSGMETVDAIAALDTDRSDRPSTDATMKSVSITES